MDDILLLQAIGRTLWALEHPGHVAPAEWHLEVAERFLQVLRDQGYEVKIRD